VAAAIKPYSRVSSKALSLPPYNHVLQDGKDKSTGAIPGSPGRRSRLFVRALFEVRPGLYLPTHCVVVLLSRRRRRRRRRREGGGGGGGRIRRKRRDP